MKLIEQSHETLYMNPIAEQLIECAGRTAYRSENKITHDSASKFVGMLRNRNHDSVLEHASATVRFVTNRGTTHEMVRHRIASFTQESTRYCNYKSDHIEFIRPVAFNQIYTVGNSVLSWGALEAMCSGDNDLDEPSKIWLRAMLYSEQRYKELIAAGCPPQVARGVLPIDLKAAIVMTANLREWRHVFSLRMSKEAAPQFRKLLEPLYQEFLQMAPAVFGDLQQPQIREV